MRGASGVRRGPRRFRLRPAFGSQIKKSIVSTLSPPPCQFSGSGAVMTHEPCQ